MSTPASAPTDVDSLVDALAGVVATLRAAEAVVATTTDRSERASALRIVVAVERERLQLLELADYHGLDQTVLLAAAYLASGRVGQTQHEISHG